MNNITERIKADAIQYQKECNKVLTTFPVTPMEHYIAGATAENSKAQVLVDALEWIKTYGPVDELTVKFIDNAIEQWKGKEVKKPPIEYMPVHPEDARKFDCPKQFPMHLLDEGQAMSNHSQSLKRLKERGGLSVHEMIAVANKKPWSYYSKLPWAEALKMLNDIVITNPQK